MTSRRSFDSISIRPLALKCSQIHETPGVPGSYVVQPAVTTDCVERVGHARLFHLLAEEEKAYSASSVRR
jgi:hypothetical protein